MVATPNPWICLLLPAEKKRNSLNKLNFSLKKIIPLKRVLYWTLPKVHEHSNTVVKQPICEQISVPKPIGIYLGHGVRVGGKIFDRLPLRRAKERLLKRNSITASLLPWAVQQCKTRCKSDSHIRDWILIFPAAPKTLVHLSRCTKTDCSWQCLRESESTRWLRHHKLVQFPLSKSVFWRLLLACGFRIL